MPDTVTGQTDTVAASSEDPRIGSTLTARYRIIAPLGEGGMGTVYRGVHEALRKPVAIKFLQQKVHGNREMIVRFEREAVTAANLRHPNIAEAIDFGTLPDGTLYLVMELVEGMPLRKLISPGQGLPVERVLRIVEQLAAALDLAHSMGIVHRDLKPENILIFDRGTARDVVKIIDFGIARINSEIFKTGPTALTAAGAVFGTPQYMAPEQVMGQTVDARADQYAVGVITYEMLTGSQPFTADNYGELVMKHVGAPAPRVVESAPHAPQALDAAVSRMMSKLPDERFATMTDALRAMKGEAPAPTLPTNSAPMSSNTVVMNSGNDAQSLAFAPTIAPGEQFALPNMTIPVAARSEMPSANHVVVPPVATPAPASAPVMAQSAPVMAQPAPVMTSPAPVATASQARSKPPIAMIAGIGAALILVVIVVVYFVAGSSGSAKEVASAASSASGVSRGPDASPKIGAPSPTAASTRPLVSNTKYRFLMKDGKYPFCVTSKLKNAYPVRTNDEGVKVCIGTPDGPIPVEGLKPYQPSEFQWE